MENSKKQNFTLRTLRTWIKAIRHLTRIFADKTKMLYLPFLLRFRKILAKGLINLYSINYICNRERI